MLKSHSWFVRIGCYFENQRLYNMEELKKIIEQKAQERYDTDPARILLRDLKFCIEEDANVSAEMRISAMSPRQIIKTLLEADQKEKVRKYGRITTVEWALMQIEKIDPEFIHSIKRKYNGQDSNN